MVSEKQFQENINNIGLILIKRNDENWILEKKGIGNPLLYFNPKFKGLKYSGTIQVKAYNLSLFSNNQVYLALKCVNEFMLGELLEN